MGEIQTMIFEVGVVVGLAIGVLLDFIAYLISASAKGEKHESV